MGRTISAALAVPLGVEVMVNPDGTLRLDRMGSGRTETGERLEPAQIERIIRLVASHARAEVRRSSVPSFRLTATAWRVKGSRACCPRPRPAPASRSASLLLVYTLINYLNDGSWPPKPCKCWRRPPRAAYHPGRAGTSSGKTTLASALLSESYPSPEPRTGGCRSRSAYGAMRHPAPFRR
jgi:type IV secretion system protein VirB11